ncbi:MAG: hypothetical protein PHY30_03330 [Candidatus Pacebacteria bacterium]|nr:hypothetical protein [Candidatus Paceibacterota bacterium]
MVKIIDIIPPNQNKDDSIQVIKKEKPKNKKLSKFLISILIIVFFCIGGAFLIEGKGNITIYPETKDASLEETIYIAAGEANIDFENSVIPGEYFDETLNFEDVYESTGSDESATKAEGELAVCSEHPKDIKLVKNTRFLSAEGELTYRAKAAFTIPKGNGNEPGCVKVEVIADDVGDEYNLSSGTFSIPGLKNTEYYTTVWGELKDGEKLFGGSRSEVRVVTEKDIDKAKDLFKEKYLAKAKESLINNLEEVGTYIYFDDSFEQTFDKFIVLASEGDKIDNFKIEATITTKVLIFRKSDIDKYVEQKLLLSEEGRVIVPNSLLKEFLPLEENDSDHYATILKVSAKTYPKISEVFIANDVKGQTIEDSLNILKSIPEIESADVSASLFWKDRLPKNKDNIQIQINFGE